MSYKVIRNASNEVVAFGPDEDGYDPVIPTGCALRTEEDMPVLTPNPKVVAAEQIRALETQYLLPRAVREFILGAVKAEAQKTGLDPMALPAYAKLKALDDQIAALRAQL